MILITDGGSTKCDWIAIDNDGNQTVEKIRTKGLNPAIIAEKKLKKIIRKSEELMAIANEVTHIFFYGAGCGTEKPRLSLKSIIETYFPKALVEVREDTYAAVRATINSNNEAAVVCILGTGSNCSYFDGMFLNKDSDYVKEVMRKGISLFAENMILQFKDEIEKGVPVHFAGSIAYFGQKEIKEVAETYGFKVGNFIRRPIEGLVDYHVKNL